MKLYAIPFTFILCFYVDKIEYNTFCNERYNFVFDQWIFYDFDLDKKEYEVVDWRLAKLTESLDINHVKQLQKEWRQLHNGPFIVWPEIKTWPVSYDGTYYTLILLDHKNNDKVIVIKSKLLVITETCFDPEINNRNILSEKYRASKMMPRNLNKED